MATEQSKLVDTKGGLRSRIKGLRQVRAADIIGAPWNWRTHPAAQVEALAASIEELGFFDPLDTRELPNGSLELIDGHARRDLLHERIGPDTMIPCVVTDFTEEEAKKANLLKDPLAAMAEADKGRLDSLLREVQTGDEALAGMLTDLARSAGLEYGSVNGNGEPDPEPQIDRAAELQKEWKTERGQLWLAGDHRLLCGDSTKAEDVARVMGGEKAKLFATDPPYGVDYIQIKAGIPRIGYASLDRDYKDIEADDLKDEKLQEFLESAFRTWLPHLDHAAWYLWHAHLTQGFFSAAAAAAAANVVLHRQIIWVKPGFNLTRSGMYHWAHEPCFYGWVKGEQPGWYGEKNQRSVWEIDRHAGKGLHPTEKPPELWHAPINNHVKLGEVCAEPFAGSGSQFVAAEQLGRRCYGIEIEPRYVAVTLQRLKDMGLDPKPA